MKTIRAVLHLVQGSKWTELFEMVFHKPKSNHFRNACWTEPSPRELASLLSGTRFASGRQPGLSLAVSHICLV